MLNNITIGQYFPGTSPVHSLDPRTKILAVVAYIVVIFLSQGFAGFLAIAAFTLLCAWLSRIPLRFLVRGLKPIAMIMAFTFVLNLFLGGSGRVLWSWGPLTITEQGIRNALFMAVRLILLVTGTQLLTLTTSPISLTDGLESLFKPFARIGFPAHELAMMMSIALRFIPTLIEETDKIMSAQRARGADFESGNLLQRAKALIPLLVPLFVSAFRRADELATAMECRCYHGEEERTKLHVLRYETRDYLTLAFYAALCAAMIALKKFF